MNRSGKQALLTVVLALAIGSGGWLPAAESESAGKELFTREWVPGDSRSHGGDGLGPVFNDTSCVACHNQGGTGGAGTGSKNVRIVTPFKNDQSVVTQGSPSTSFVGTVARAFFGGGSRRRATAKAARAEDGEAPPATKEAEAKKAAVRKEREELAKIHPGFRTARSVILHRFGTQDRYTKWRDELGGDQFSFVAFSSASTGAASADRRQRLQFEAQFDRFGVFSSAKEGEPFVLSSSERNSTALFGSGLIDKVPAEAIEAAAKVKHEGFAGITGRVARLKDGRIGRFGWKAQKATLGDFVLTACAVELGLHVPGEPQSGAPHDPDYVAPGLDLTATECDQLTAYLASLSAPREHVPSTAHEADVVRSGKEAFTRVGCAACHAPSLGCAEGIYSDLLLHDLGPTLGDTGSYGSFAPDRTEEEELTELIPGFNNLAMGGTSVGMHDSGVERTDKKRTGASRQEWRTPPLWGVRDSAPYLHDGRAATLEHAIAFHDGEASKSSHRYFALPQDERLHVLSFLRSLVAPEPAGL